MCECGFQTFHRPTWSTHQKTCKLITDRNQSQILAVFTARIASLEASLAEAKAQLATKDEQMLLLLKKPRAPPKRKSLTEPERRDIAKAQAWLCADPDGQCMLQGELREYEVDHITPLFIKGAEDHPGNMQALCPACHSRKTKRDQVKRARLGCVDPEGPSRDPEGTTD